MQANLLDIWRIDLLPRRVVGCYRASAEVAAKLLSSFYLLPHTLATQLQSSNNRTRQHAAVSTWSPCSCRLQGRGTNALQRGAWQCRGSYGRCKGAQRLRIAPQTLHCYWESCSVLLVTVFQAINPNSLQRCPEAINSHEQAKHLTL